MYSELMDIDSNVVLVDDIFISKMEEYNKKNKINRKDYRKRINKLYDNIKQLKPIDNEISNNIYYEDYIEKGIVINKTDISLKQIWTEYRLIYNEKERELGGNYMENSFVLDNFDDIFDNLSKKVDGVNKYIDELNVLKKDLDNDGIKMNKEKEALELERVCFNNYKNEENQKLEQKNKELNEKLQKVDKLLKSLDEKLESIIG